MTLKEKFIKCRNKTNEYYILPVVDDAEQLVKVADEFAIDFAQWLLIHYDKDNTPSKDKIKKLLEMYKL